MKKLSLALLIALGLQLPAFSQYFQQEVNYNIDVSLNDKEQSAEVTAKYKTLIDALGGADLNIKNAKK